MKMCEKPKASVVWFHLSTREQRLALAKHAGISETYLTQILRDGREPSAEIAGRIEAGMSLIQAVTDRALPKLKRGDVCNTCATCKYYKG